MGKQTNASPSSGRRLRRIPLLSENEGKALGIGFNQTAESEEVRSCMSELLEVEQKNIDVFTKVLQEDSPNIPRFWDSHVTDSRVAPFSDKFMIYLKGFLTSLAMSNYGTGMSTSNRIDLAIHYKAAIARKAQLGVNAANIMIDNGWFEKPPEAADRKTLAE